MTKYTVILNPTSRGGEAADDYSLIDQTLQAAGLDFKIIETTAVGEAVEITRKVVEEGTEWVIAAGGDGTVNEVINGLMLAKAESKGEAGFGVIPIGRGNDFAYGANIPMDIEEAISLLANDNSKIIDIGYLQGGDFPEGRYFGNGVGIGFDAVVGFEAVKVKILPPGFLSYLVGALKTTFLYFKAPLLRIELDDEVIEKKALMVSIMNGRRMGGGFLMAPTSKIDDGKLDLCLVHELSKLKILQTIPKFFQGSQVNDPNVSMLQSRRAVITAVEGSLPSHADGETICYEGHKISIELLPKALKVITRG